LLRLNADGKPFVSDGGHHILDCAFTDVNAESLAKELDHIVGLVEHGLFIGFAKEVHVASASGVQIMVV
jgi:ribose 5-phosphate isomerase A